MIFNSWLTISPATVVQLSFEKLFAWTLWGMFGHFGAQQPLGLRTGGYNVYITRKAMWPYIRLEYPFTPTIP